MDAKTVCLGLLSFGEASGYDLKKHVETSGDYFFAAGFGSIYPALSSLMSQGLIERAGKATAGRRDRKAYRITPAGRSELARTLNVLEPRHSLRSDLFALLYLAHLVSPERITQVVDERLAAMKAELSREHDSSLPLEHPSPASARFVAGLRAALLETTVRYFQEHRKQLESGRNAS
ncbi:MAG: PadR family transcriptional regulator [Gammaproteobacteria bacterium]